MNTNYQYKPACTPEQIVNNNLTFNIPIYQRLFVWEEEQVNLLLDDLYKSFKQPNSGQPYYIGIITVVKNNDNWDVVDGQQRLTFLSLFGACSCSQDQDSQNWKKFLYIDDKPTLRIDYMGRPEDREDLTNLAKKEDMKNRNFRIFRECIEKFRKDKNDWNNFTEYVYRHASFLISELPENYSPEDLNLFFEKMNSTGKQLTPVEQIKGMYFPGHSTVFDACLNFEDAFKNPDETNGGTNSRLLDILNDKTTEVTLEKPAAPSDEAGAKSILKPEVFLLHCLDIAITKRQNKTLNKTLRDERKILDFFKANVNVADNDNKITPGYLLGIMKGYRGWLDKNIIYLGTAPDGSIEYRFRDEDEEQNKEADKMKQFQSMLYVSSSDYQEWVLNAYQHRKDFSLDWLKKQDKHELDSMTYPSINRYWFWKLDYLLWERFIDGNLTESDKLTEDEKTAIKNYKFRRNRSIEHLHPQTDNGVWSEVEKNQFGNLAMISSSFNSLQQNDTVGVKFARLKDTQIPQKSLESIKLLLMFALAGREESGWTSKKAETHGYNMLALLTSETSHDYFLPAIVYDFHSSGMWTGGTGQAANRRI